VRAHAHAHTHTHIYIYMQDVWSHIFCVCFILSEGYPEIKETKQVGRVGKPLLWRWQPSCLQPRLHSQRFPFVFAFKETPGQPEVAHANHGRSCCVGGWQKVTLSLSRQQTSMDWVCWWDNHMAHVVSPSTVLAFVTKMSEKCTSTSQSAIQVKNWQKIIRTEEILYIIH
jgi:hypothetical protein